MKSIITLTATIALAITFTLNACDKGGGNVKLLETITDESGKVQRFEYDKQNRIVKIDDKTITYTDNLITVGTQKYVINGKTITVDSESFTINGDGYITVPSGSGCDGCEFFEYKDGNLIADNSGRGIFYEYDDKKSPFSDCTTPKWLIQHLLRDIYASKNNVVRIGEEDGPSIYKYEYDNDGFPITAKITEQYTDYAEGTGTTTTITTTRFTYRGETQNATTEPAAEVATQEAATQEAVAEKPAEKAGGGDTQDGCPNAVTGNGTLSCGGQTYKTVKMGEQVWMAENINIEMGKSVCPISECQDEAVCDNDNNCKEYGRLYDWETAMKACPSGWHLPSNDEWQKLVDFAGGKETAGKKLQDKDGFSALLGGRNPPDGEDGFAGLSGYWWSSSEEDDEYAYSRRMSYKDNVYGGSDRKNFQYSVRCIKD
jgi:uncharacterized protein (TIGR02145 family)